MLVGEGALCAFPPDAVATLTSRATTHQSRNFTVGFRIGRGETLEEILTSLGSVAEGVETARSAYEMVQSKGVSAPILEHVYVPSHSSFIAVADDTHAYLLDSYRLLWEGETAKALARSLMDLPSKCNSAIDCDGRH